jgi:hypothetical protein
VGIFRPALTVLRTSAREPQEPPPPPPHGNPRKTQEEPKKNPRKPKKNPPKPKKNPPSPPNSRFQRLVRSWEYAGEKRRREMSPSALFHEMPPEMRTRYTQGGPK